MTRRLVCFVPTDMPVGGIAKLLDYAVHGIRAGLDVTFCCQNFKHEPGASTLFSKPYYKEYGAEIELCDGASLVPKSGDIVLFTLPSSHAYLSRTYFDAKATGIDMIHLLQNVRVANTAFDNGYSYRLLSKPIWRVAITKEVYDAVLPHVEDRTRLDIIPHGFDFDAFDRAPERDDPIVINYNTFKGAFGAKVVAPFRDRPEVYGIQVASKGISWDDLREQYRSSSIFVGTPLPEEGLYLPGLEAMAAGHALITPDAFGNRFYCDFDGNCCEVPFEDVQAYHDKLEWLIANWSGAAFEMRQRAHEKAADLGLEGEMERFADKLEEIGLED